MRVKSMALEERPRRGGALCAGAASPSASAAPWPSSNSPRDLFAARKAKERRRASSQSSMSSPHSSDELLVPPAWRRSPASSSAAARCRRCAVACFFYFLLLPRTHVTRVLVLNYSSLPFSWCSRCADYAESSCHVEMMGFGIEAGGSVWAK